MAGDEVEKFVPYRKAGGHRTQAQREAEGLEVLRLKRMGMVDSQIAQTLNMSIPTVHVRKREALALFGESTAAEYREVIKQQYEVLIQASMPGVQAEDPQAIGNMTRILANMSRLLGVDAPQTVDLNVTVETEQEKQMREMFARMEAQTAAAEEALIVDGEVVEDGGP